MRKRAEDIVEPGACHGAARCPDEMTGAFADDDLACARTEQSRHGGSKLGDSC